MDEKTFKQTVDKFIKSIRSKHVYLRLDQIKFKPNDTSFRIHVLFDLKNDPYINSTHYDEGDAFIYLADQLYKDVDKKLKELFGNDAKMDWNNTATIGWSYFN